MPNHKSAKKRMRQNEKRRQINRGNRSRMRTAIKKLRTALTGSDANETQTLLPATISTIDKAVNKGIIHRNTAARYKSRLTARVNAGADASASK
jgi:small subunit ribosomal protein S20